MFSMSGIAKSDKSTDIDSFMDKVINGDSLEVLKTLPPESVDVMITSPPYFQQRDYGSGIGNEKNDEDYLNKIVEVFSLCVKAVKKEGSLFVNIGDKYRNGSLILIPYRFAMKAKERENVILMNEISWVKPNPQPRQFQRRLVNAHEPFFHFVKSNKYQYFPDNFMAYEDQLRENKKKVNGNNNIGKRYFELVDGSTLSDEQKKLAYEELNQVIKEVKNGEISSFRMKIQGIHSAAYGGYEGGRKKHIEEKGFTIIRMPGRSLKRDVIECPILQEKYLNHPAIYPEYIVQELLNLTSKEGDVILDPFLGSGTTAVVAKKMGRHYIGIDLNAEYCELAISRLQKVGNQQLNLEYFV